MKTCFLLFLLISIIFCFTSCRKQQEVEKPSVFDIYPAKARIEANYVFQLGLMLYNFAENHEDKDTVKLFLKNAENANVKIDPDPTTITNQTTAELVQIYKQSITSQLDKQKSCCFLCGRSVGAILEYDKVKAGAIARSEEINGKEEYETAFFLIQSAAQESGLISRQSIVALNDLRQQAIAADTLEKIEKFEANFKAWYCDKVMWEIIGAK